MERALVVGGSGWMGSYLVYQLRCCSDEFEKVLNLDVVPPRADLKSLHEGTYERCDIRNRREVQAIFESFRPTVVFHLASIVDLRSVPDPIAEEVNVKGTMNLLKESSRSKSCRCFVYTSSIDVVGGHFGIQNADESSPYPSNPSNMYKKSKGEAERQVLAANNPQNLCTVSLRPGHLFGPGDLLPNTVTGFPVAIGDVTRSKMSFTYIENAALAHLECFRYMKTRRSLDGKTAFITDFEINFFVAYYSITRKKLPLLWIPTEMFWLLLLLIEFVTRIVFSIIPLRFNPIHKITGLNTASIESGVVLTASNSRARETFDYLSSKRGYVPRNLALQRASNYYHMGSKAYFHSNDRIYPVKITEK